jgi:hypothetical protein
MNFEEETDIKYQCGRRHFKWFLGWILPKRIKKKTRDSLNNRQSINSNIVVGTVV